ncbi:MAG TPA: mechanosensitive ion channel domain-containing protein, partial [Polyangiaceae bacterium]|nr:mechanosensitive ion channel domain-containing protein [Polyangiaceae bacterium]
RHHGQWYSGRVPGSTEPERRGRISGVVQVRSKASAWLSLLLFCLSACVFSGCSLGGGADAEGALEPPATKLDGPILGSARAKLAIRPEDALKSAPELVNRAQAAMRELSRIGAEARVPAELETLSRELPSRLDELKARVASADVDLRRSRRNAWVRDIRFAFVEDDAQLTRWQASARQTADRLDSGRQRLSELLDFWRRADELALRPDVVPEIRLQTNKVVQEAQSVELLVARPDAVMIPLQATLAEMRNVLDAFLRDADRNGPNLWRDAPERDASVLGTLRALAGLRDAVTPILSASRHMLHMGRLFLAASGEQVLAHLLFMGLSLVGVLALRSHRGGWVGEEREGSTARRVVEHPLAATILLGMVASAAFYDALPTLAVLIVYALAVAAALVLFPRILERELLRAGYVLVAFMLLDGVRLFVIEIAALERFILTLELLAATLALGMLLRNRSWLALPRVARAPGWFRGVAWLWFGGAAVGTLAALAGYGSLAEILGGGVLVSMYLALILAAAFAAAGGTVWVLTQARLLGRLNSVRKNRTAIVSGASRWLGRIAWFLWVAWSLDYLTLAHGAARLVRRIFGAALQLGTLKVSVGEVLVLALGAVLAVGLARLVRLLLEEDIVSRLDLSASTGQVTSLTAYYLVLLFGFFLALAAAGIELGKFTVLAGAFGVGIGFGLQNVVQNFIAGLLLLFGGPIKVGDKIQIGDLIGEVRSIGFRASTVRTGQGAEVIVPNAKLIADQVINWTLSDKKRRLEIDIGVAYGTDPERVLGILTEIGRSHPKVLAEPAPAALFLQHAESTLNCQLQVWVMFDDSVAVRSDLTLAINKRLVQEKIGISFPQRDLHLVSVEPEVLQALRALPNKS